MYLLYFLLIATPVLSEGVLQEMNFSQPVSAADYQHAIEQGFATNYFKAKNPAAKYRTKNIKDIYDKGFRNLRLRCRADLYDAYNTTRFTIFLEKLGEVVDECIRQKIAPIISWIHHTAEGYATERDRQNYLDWSRRVAESLKHRNYHLSFNLFTELGVDECKKKETVMGVFEEMERNTLTGQQK